ncbi:hypothetical protein ABID23_000718 [Bartonella silvatica]|uniref:Uncharacterized protein n=1 Tax=Bartonella silvatica TaxID=357760 RepID=A0ABV2HGF2_9HYPH
MLRSLLKFMAFIFITLTIIVLVIDSVHSIKASHWVITPLNKVLANLLHTDIDTLNQSIQNTIPTFMSSVCISLINLPVWFILGALSIVLCILNHEKQEPFHKKSYI